MSKFCVSCGANNPDMRDTCWRCNAPLGGNAGNQWKNSPPPVYQQQLQSPVYPQPLQPPVYSRIISKKYEWWSVVMHIFSGMMLLVFLILSGALSSIEDKAGNWMDFIDSSYSNYLSIAKMAAFILFLCVCSAISGGVFLNSRKKHAAVLYNVYGAIFCFWAILHFITMLKLDVPSELMTVIFIFLVDIAIWVISAIFMFMKGNIRNVVKQYIN